MARLVPIETPAKRLVPVDDAPAAAALTAPEDVRDDRGVPGGDSMAPNKRPRRSVADNLQIGAQNVGRGLADLLGFPVDMASAGINLALTGAEKATGAELPRVEQPFLGSQYIADKSGQAFEALGGDIIADEELTPTERIVGDAVRVATGALGGGAALTRNAARNATRQAPVLDALSKPYEVNAARTVAGDVAGGAGAGGALGVYEEAVPEEQQGPLGALIASLLGGVGGVGAKAAVEGVANAGANTVRGMVGKSFDDAIAPDPLTGARATRKEADQAAARVQAQASNPQIAARNIADNTAEFDQIAPRGAQPTAGAVSDDVGLAILENTERAKDPRSFIQRDKNVSTQARSQVDQSVPAAANSRELSDFIDRRVREAFDRIEAEKTAARAAIKEPDVSSGVSQYAGKGADASRRIDEAFRGSLDEATRRKNELYNDPELLSAPVDAERLYRFADEMESSLGPVGDPASIPSDIIGRIKSLADIDPESGEVSGFKSMTYADVQDLRAQVSEAIQVATADAGKGASGSGPRVRNLKALRDELSSYADELAQGEGGTAEKARAALTNYREDFAPRFREGKAGEFAQAVKTDRYGTRTRPEDTASKFLGGGKGDDVESLNRAINMADVPERAQDARTYMLSDLASSSAVDAKTGALRPDTVRRWYDRNREVVKRVPGLQRELNGLLEQAKQGKRLHGEFTDEVKALDARFAEKKTAVERGVLGKAQGKEPTKAVATAFNADDPEKAVAELVAEIGDNKSAKDGLKAAIRDYMVDRATTTALQKTNDGQRPLSFSKLENFFNDNAKPLAQVYTPEEMNSLRAAHKLLKSYGNLGSRAVSGSDTNEKSQRMFRALEAGLKAKYGILKGGGILRTIRVAIEALPNDQVQVDRLVHRMMFDPDLAVHLLSKKVQDKVNTPEWNAKLNKLIAAGAAAREATDE